MKTRLLFLCVCTAFAGVSFVSAYNNKTIIPISSDLYILIENLYHETGRVPPNDSKPWTADEMAAIVDEIDPSGLSEAGRRAFTYLTGQLSKKDAAFSEDSFSFDSSPSLTIETFMHIPVKDTTDAKPESYEWIHGYEERRPFLHIPLEFWYGDTLYMISELTAKEEYNSITSPGTPDVAHNYFNILFDDPNIRLDLYFPFRAVLATGGDWWNFLFGRDKLCWGGGVTGNLMLSDYSDFYDFAGLTLFSPSFKMTNIYIVSDPFLPDGTDVGFSGFIGHRLEMRFLEKIKFVINESVTFANLPPELPNDLNYLMVFHNWMSPERFNSLLSVELEYTPWRYFSVYGHLAMDEFATTYEEERGGGGGPPIYGFLAGIKGSYPAGPGYINGVFEWVQTSPWLYNRRAAPYFYNVRKYWSLTTDATEYATKPFGYEYGADSAVYFLSGSYSVPGSFSGNIDLTRIVQGEKQVGSTWDPAPGDKPPTGIPEKKWIIGFDGSWQLCRFINVGAGLNLSFTTNPQHVDGEKRTDFEVTAFATAGL